MTIDIYSMRMSPPCRAVLMTAKHLNIDLNEKFIDLSEGQQLSPEFLKLNPAHTVPTIDDNGFILWESRAIMQYLCNKYAPDSSLYPKDPKKRALVDRWLNFDIGLYPTQYPKWVYGIDAPADKMTAYVNNLKLLDSLISTNKYITGDELTIADLSVLATLSVQDYGIDSSVIDLNDYPNLKRWKSTTRSSLPYYDEINNVSAQEFVEVLKKAFAKKSEK